jgi:hypothetical protein
MRFAMRHGDPQERGVVGELRPDERWTAEEESAMVNSFDDGWSIAAISGLLHRGPAVVRDRLHVFGRLPACDPVRAEEDRQLAVRAEPASRDPAPPGPEVLAPTGYTPARGPIGRILARFLRSQD